MSSSLVAWITARFSPLYFANVFGFPNVVPDIKEWGDYLPNFREDKDDNPVEHLFEFHKIMDKLDIHHEDVLMNLFMFSLGGYAHNWYKSFPPLSISSLKKFHSTFQKHCTLYFPKNLLLEHCCGEFELYIQHTVVYDHDSINVDERKSFGDEELDSN